MRRRPTKTSRSPDGPAWRLEDSRGTHRDAITGRGLQARKELGLVLAVGAGNSPDRLDGKSQQEARREGTVPGTRVPYCYSFRHEASQKQWEENDLIDPIAISTAIVHCDVVVTERQWTDSAGARSSASSRKPACSAT